MAKRKGQVVLSTLVTQDTGIRIPIVDSNDIGGGRMYVDTIAERNAIPVKLRKVGMVVRVYADSTDYELLAGFGANDATISDNFWKVYAPGLPEGVLTEHQKVEDIEFEDTTEFAKLTDKLDAMDQATENVASDVSVINTTIATMQTQMNDSDLITVDQSDTSLTNAIAGIRNSIDELVVSTTVEPNVNVFEIQDNIKETGSTVTSIDIKWVFNKVVSSAVLKINGTQVADLATGGKVATVGSKNVTGLAITADTDVVLEITDSDAATATKVAKVIFKDKILYGAIDSTTETITQSVMDTLTKSGLLENPYNKYVRIDCGNTGDKVPVIAVPSSLNVDETQLVFLNGYTNSWTKSTVSYTNESGGTFNYDVFVFDEVLVDKVVMTIVELL